MALTTVQAGMVGTLTPTNLDTQAQYTGFKNRIINGAMVIDQRNAGASTAPTDAYTLDRWEVREDTDGAITCQQVADAPTGFNFSAKITTTTADASLTGTQRLFFRQPIEGNNAADLAFGTASAANITLSFWVKSSLTGTFGGAFSNQSSVRSYAFTYTISTANTWEYKTVTIAGDTSGTWQTGTGAGLNVFFALGMGPDYSGAAGSWVTATRLSATGAVSVIGTLNATWQVTGVQLEKGSTATSFDYRPIQTELDLCYRYCFAWRTDNTGYTNYSRFPVSFNTSTTECNTDIFLPKPMRNTAYSINWNNKSYQEYFVTGGGATGTGLALNTDANAINWVNIRFAGMTGTALTVGGFSGIRMTNATDAVLVISTEL